MSNWTEDGKFIPDDTPVEVPLNIKPLSQDEKIAKAVTEQLSIQAAKKGKETFTESMDFEISDDNDPLTTYENVAEMTEEFLNADLEEQPVMTLEEYTNDALTQELQRRANADAAQKEKHQKPEGETESQERE